MKSSLTRSPFALPAILLAIVLAGAALTGTAAARSSVFDAPAQMNLVFTDGSAHLVGSQALIQVRCEGPQSGICNGTAVLKVAGKEHKVPFAVTGGARSSLTVSLHSAGSLRGRRAVAVAKTAQQSGGYLRAREVLRLK